MKPNDIQRGIAPRKARGDSGNSFELGRIAKVRARSSPTASSGHRSRRRGRSDTQERRRGLLILSAVFGAGALAVIGLAMTMWLLPKLRSGGAAEANPAVAAGATHPAGPREDFVPPTSDEALRLVRGALEVRDPAMVPDYFRMGSATAEEIADFLMQSDARDGLATGYEWQSSLDAGGMQAEGVVVSYSGRQRRTERLACLTPDEMGRWKVDFDAFARTCSPVWDKLADFKGDPVVRACLMRDSYYNGIFGDDKEWQSYSIQLPEKSQGLRAYCKRGTPQAAAVESLLADGRYSRGTFQLRRLPGAEKWQFEIVGLVSREWLVPDQMPPPSAANL